MTSCQKYVINYMTICNNIIIAASMQLVAPGALIGRTKQEVTLHSGYIIMMQLLSLIIIMDS